MGIFGKSSEYKKKYIEGALLGQGNFADVKSVTRKSDNKQFASKIIDMSKGKNISETDKKAIKSEIELMELIQQGMGGKPHPNIISLEDKITEGGKTYLILELVTGGELFDRIVKKSHYGEKECAELVGTIIQALGFLHERGIVHRDLKPENLLYQDESDDSQIKIADFGLAKLASDKEAMQTACGTPGYVAPEVLKCEPYGAAVDMWGMGVITYILLCGFPPFYEEDMPKLFQQIINAQYDFPSPWWDDVSQEAKDFVGRLLTIDPNKRYVAQPERSPLWALKDPWFNKTHADLHLKGAQKTLKRYQATRKLRKVGAAIMATKRIANMLGEHKDSV